ncbi:MAG: HEPN domain-containing protein [Elusimicrobia bacterium]|nr:HEPN domain-containing protein [Elusimicrobiota bacterium]
MTNHDAAIALWEKALHIRKADASAAMQKGDFNLCIRRAQEAVELALKAALRFLGFDYPKHHDVGDLFRKACRERKIVVSDDALERVRTISSELSNMRAPAFYLEEVYARDDAVKSLEGADFVLETVKSVMRV